MSLKLQSSYAAFNEFVRRDIQLERSRVNRRMLSVFIWCFFLPAVFSVIFLLMIKFGVFPRSARAYLDWIVLSFPLFYSIYFLSSQVLISAPAAFKRGGVATTLVQHTRESEWRQSVCESMKKELGFSLDQLKWVVLSFKIDLERLQYRNRYLTALAGAVFFLIMQGIDTLADTEHPKVNVLGISETFSSNFSQFVGLVLFLVLLYLSGTQTINSLQRYLGAAELLELEMASEK